MKFDKQLLQILEEISDGAYIVDSNRKILFWNRAAEKITGFVKDEVVGKSCKDNILNHVDEKGNLLCNTLCPIVNTFKSNNKSTAEVYLHKKNGSRSGVSVNFLPLEIENDTFVLEIFRENSVICHSKAYIDKLISLSQYDFLTELPNRRYFNIKLKELIFEHKRYGHNFYLAICDIDDFKYVNDTYGHDVGDKVLKMVSSTLRHNVRVTDFVARWGGEEFVILLTHTDNISSVKAIEKLRVLIKKSFLNLDKDTNIEITMTFGITLFKDEDDEETILKRADNLLRQGKNNGKNRVVSD